MTEDEWIATLKALLQMWINIYMKKGLSKKRALAMARQLLVEHLYKFFFEDGELKP